VLASKAGVQIMFSSWFIMCTEADVGADHEGEGVDVESFKSNAPLAKVPRLSLFAKSDVQGDVFPSDTGFEREITTFSVRTARDDSIPAEQALQKLQDGNQRFLEGQSRRNSTFVRENSEALVAHGQNPYAILIGCADSRCPLEIMFDAEPGDLFVLRNAGNTLTHAEASMVGSVEYSVGNLHTNLVVVVGHTNCGAIAGATKKALASAGTEKSDTTLDTLLNDLGPVALQAKAECHSMASVEEIAAHAVRVNVFHTIEKLLTYSEPLRAKARSGALQLHGAIFDIATGQVEFLGPSPRQCLLLDSESMLFPRVVFSAEDASRVGGA
jgi:carbonic anhydrase